MGSAMRQGVQTALRRWERLPADISKEVGPQSYNCKELNSANNLIGLEAASSQSFPVRAQMADTLIFGFVKPGTEISWTNMDFWCIQQWDNTFVLSKIVTFVVICYGSNRILIPYRVTFTFLHREFKTLRTGLPPTFLALSYCIPPYTPCPSYRRHLTTPLTREPCAFVHGNLDWAFFLLSAWKHPPRCYGLVDLAMDRVSEGELFSMCRCPPIKYKNTLFYKYVFNTSCVPGAGYKVTNNFLIKIWLLGISFSCAVIIVFSFCDH